MMTIRPSAERGHADHGWLDTCHTFSFADYYDPRHMGFRDLRVINEDRVQPGRGFGTHSHRDMEILTYVLEGALEHRDSMGNESVIRPGEIQRLSAGTGLTHSEYNHADTERVHFLQMWILPRARGLTPGYEQRAFAEADSRGRLLLVAAADGRQGAVTLHQDAELWVTRLARGERVAHPLRPGRHAWVQVARGAVTVNGRPLEAGDGAALSDEPEARIAASEAAEVLLFDLK